MLIWAGHADVGYLGDCFQRLKSVPVGRIGFVSGGEVVILPVNFLVDGQDIVFRTAAGSKLSAVEVGHYVGFEADSYDQATGTGWSVVVNGLAEIVDSDAEAARLDALGLPSRYPAAYGWPSEMTKLPFLRSSPRPSGTVGSDP